MDDVAVFLLIMVVMVVMVSLGYFLGLDYGVSSEYNNVKDHCEGQVIVVEVDEEAEFRCVPRVEEVKE